MMSDFKYFSKFHKKLHYYHLRSSKRYLTVSLLEGEAVKLLGKIWKKYQKISDYNEINKPTLTCVMASDGRNTFT